MLCTVCTDPSVRERISFQLAFHRKEEDIYQPYSFSFHHTITTSDPSLRLGVAHTYYHAECTKYREGASERLICNRAWYQSLGLHLHMTGNPHPPPSDHFTNCGLTLPFPRSLASASYEGVPGGWGGSLAWLFSLSSSCSAPRHPDAKETG